MGISINRFFEQLKGQQIAFIGTGVSHIDTIKLFCTKGLSVVVCDKKTKEQLGQVYDDLKTAGASFSLGDSYLDALSQSDVIFRTPGMNFFHPALQQARAESKVVTSEMEVFFELCPCKIFAVTGSDGKTTTTTLISEFLSAQGKTVHKGGNIGRALLPIIDTIQPTDVAVVELSSFQLISMRQAPDVAVITNIAPNHLDVHKDMEEYIEAKCNLISHQNAFSKTILNADNALTASLSPLVRGSLWHFSRQTAPQNGAYLNAAGYLCMMVQGNETVLFHKDEIKLPGIHNVENYLAAITAVYDCVDKEHLLMVAREFGGVAHRIELVRTLDGVRWYNDSIATSPTRTIAGLNSFNQKLIVIAGGYDKKLAYEPLAPKLIEKVKILILLGATAPKIEKAVLDCADYRAEDLKILHVASMQQAVDIAKSLAKDGDVVTLSPASASFDMYPNFEVRGNEFKEMVHAL